MSEVSDDIREYFKEYYGEDFFTAGTLFPAFQPFYGYTEVVNFDTFKLGETPEEMSKNFEDIFLKYPKNDFYCVFYTVIKYRTEQSIAKFIAENYEEGSRFPKQNISQEEQDYKDGIEIRCKFLDKRKIVSEMISRSYNIKDEDEKFDERMEWPFSSNKLAPEEEIREYTVPCTFYRYKCDKLYLKYLEEEEKNLRERNTYALSRPDPEQFYVLKLASTFDEGKWHEPKKGFVEYVNERSVFIKLDHKRRIAIARLQDSDARPDKYVEMYIPKENQVHLAGKLFKDAETYNNFRKSLTKFRRVGYTPRDFFLSEFNDYKIYDSMEYELEFFPNKSKPIQVEDFKDVYASVKFAKEEKDEQPT